MRISAAPVVLFLLLCSCATKQADRPHARVNLRDGSSLTGSVVANSPSEITIAGDDNSSRTIAMSQVKSIEYDDAPQTPPAATQTNPAAPSPTKPAPQSQAAHREHYHPPQSVV